jgi:hypothetical protein
VVQARELAEITQIAIVSRTIRELLAEMVIRENQMEILIPTVTPVTVAAGIQV